MREEMNEPYFGQKEVVPDEPKIRKALGDLYPAYRELVDLTGPFSHEWKYYGKNYGWQLKVTHKGKALLYITPLKGSFRVGFAVRENEKELLLNSKLSRKTKGELETARKYSEGYPIRVDVTARADMKNLQVIVQILQEART